MSSLILDTFCVYWSINNYLVLDLVPNLLAKSLCTWKKALEWSNVRFGYSALIPNQESQWASLTSLPYLAPTIAPWTYCRCVKWSSAKETWACISTLIQGEALQPTPKKMYKMAHHSKDSVLLSLWTHLQDKSQPHRIPAGGRHGERESDTVAKHLTPKHR